MTGYKRWGVLLIGMVATLALLGCSITGIGLNAVEVGELRRDSVTVEQEDAETVDVQIRMGAGELNIDNGSATLMEADFAYNVENWEPVVSYDVDDGRGRLTVRQPNTGEVSINRETRNEWDLRFADDAPLEMRIELGAGDQNIDLAGLWIIDLDMKLGAGDAEVTLSDNRELERIEFDMGAGEVDIDMRGPWDQDVDVDIQGGVGRTVLRLPADVGVRVEVTRGLGDVDTSGLSRRGDAWVNDAYGTSDIEMQINIQAGIGQVVLSAD